MVYVSRGVWHVRENKLSAPSRKKRMSYGGLSVFSPGIYVKKATRTPTPGSEKKVLGKRTRGMVGESSTREEGEVGGEEKSQSKRESIIPEEMLRQAEVACRTRGIKELLKMEELTVQARKLGLTVPPEILVGLSKTKLCKLFESTRPTEYQMMGGKLKAQKKQFEIVEDQRELKEFLLDEQKFILPASSFCGKPDDERSVWDNYWKLRDLVTELPPRDFGGGGGGLPTKRELCETIDNHFRKKYRIDEKSEVELVKKRHMTNPEFKVLSRKSEKSSKDLETIITACTAKRNLRDSTATLRKLFSEISVQSAMTEGKGGWDQQPPKDRVEICEQLEDIYLRNFGIPRSQKNYLFPGPLLGPSMVVKDYNPYSEQLTFEDRLHAPAKYRDGQTGILMQFPVLASDGQTYDANTALEMIERKLRSTVSKEVLKPILIPRWELFEELTKYFLEEYGLRLPTIATFRGLIKQYTKYLENEIMILDLKEYLKAEGLEDPEKIRSRIYQAPCGERISQSFVDPDAPGVQSWVAVGVPPKSGAERKRLSPILGIIAFDFLDEEKTIIDVSLMCVESEYSSQGIGKLLMLKLANFARFNPTTKYIVLESVYSAVGFYEKVGFYQEKETKSFISMLEKIKDQNTTLQNAPDISTRKSEILARRNLYIKRLLTSIEEDSFMVMPVT